MTTEILHSLYGIRFGISRGAPGSAQLVLDGVPLGNATATGRIVTAAGAVTITNNDSIVEIAKTVAAATTVNLPALPTAYKVFTIKDGGGNSGANPITLTPSSGTIDGLSTYVLQSNYGAVDIYHNGTAWRIK